MDGVTAIGQRIADIQSRFARPPSLAPQAASAATAGSFSAALDRARSAAARPVSGTPDAAGAGTVTAAGVPEDLATYGNGAVPAAALREIGVGAHRMWDPAARSLQQLRVAAAADGVAVGVTDSYRSLDEQADLVRRKGLYSQGGLAAAPGTSDHGWGLSVDLDLDARAQEWMRANGARFGFAEDVAREPWHWTYQAGA